MRFYGLKAQQLLARGIAPGKCKQEKSPWKGKSVECQVLLPCQGDNLDGEHTQGVALGCMLIGLSARLTG